MSMQLYKMLLKNVPASASVAVEGKASSEFGRYIDTGSYTLNAALSGSLFGGIPDNKITAFAGESSTGKTFYVLGILKSWMEQHPTGVVVYFDTESAVTNQMLTDRGLDITRIIKVEPETIEQFLQSAVAILDNYKESKTTDPMIMVLDSLSNMSSAKETQDVRDQKETQDMTKPKLIRATFRVLRLRTAKLNVPVIVTNHVYSSIGPYAPTKVLSGGGGLVYVSDSIAMLSKSKDKDKDKNVIGSIVTVTMYKSRLSRENTKVECRISYAGGLDRYYGLIDMGIAAGLIKSSTGRLTFPGSDKAVFASKVAEAPEQYFTEEFLKELDEKYVKPNFSYGSMVAMSSTPTEEDGHDED